MVLAFDFRTKIKALPWDGHWHSANDKGSEGVCHYFLEHSGIHKDQWDGSCVYEIHSNSYYE